MAPAFRSQAVLRLGLGILAGAFALVPLVAPARAAHYLIRPDGTGDFPTLQAGLDAMADGDTLLLADGVFSGLGNRDLRMPEYAAYFHAQHADPTRCAIDLGGAPLGHAGYYCEFRNIEIRRGQAVTGYLTYSHFFGCVFRDPICIASGQENGLRLTDCEIVGGSSPTGCLGPVEGIELLRCRVTGYEGGCLFRAWDLDASECVFEQNSCTDGLLAASPWMAMESSIDLHRCQFYDNVAPEGVVSSSDGFVTADECTFARNAGPSLVSEVFLGSFDITLQIVGCTMADNRGLYEIRLVREYETGISTTFHVERSILAFREGGCAVTCSGENILTELSCCDIYGNEGGDWTGCIAEHHGVNGNIALDPLFCGGDDGYRLQDDSPCAPGATCAELIGAWPVGCPSDVPPAPEVAGAPLLVLHPNPSLGRVCFQGFAGTGTMAIDLYDTAGRWVHALAGDGGASRSWVWDGRSAHGKPVPAGVYLYHARSGTREQRGSVVLTR